MRLPVAREGWPFILAPALAALEGDAIEVGALVADRVPLARADEALRRAAEPGVLKVLVDCR